MAEIARKTSTIEMGGTIKRPDDDADHSLFSQRTTADWQQSVGPYSSLQSGQ